MSAIYSVQCVDSDTGTETWVDVEATNPAQAQTLAAQYVNAVVGQVKVKLIRPDPAPPPTNPTVQTAAQGVSIIAWGIIAVVVFVVMLTVGSMFGSVFG